LTLKGWNATKALNHVTKAVGNNDVKACTGSIPKESLSVFQAFRFKRMGSASVKRQHEEAFSETISNNQNSLSVMFETQRIRASKASGASAEDIIDMTGDIDQNVGATNATKLTMAIAEFVYCKGLSFSATEGEHFMRILKLSRLVSLWYCPPSRKLLSNDLLQVCYDNRLERYQHVLEVDSDVYGLSLFGDGATVHGMPLMNILASGVGEPSAVLAIIECKCVVDCCVFLFLFPY
jgi:hypothetical protein